MTRARKKQGKVDFRVILDDNLGDFFRQLTEKSCRSFQEEIRFIIKQQMEKSV